ncbi:MAG: UDP-3-O-(3-hydroxymyristoyl)glucosamine N-acyltransferase [Candidatus Paracaedibacteraceae bacterium]|nr:UDP-3-O-(3-hydroxymyristoyl)glucosamine N-acyltransferase [Candidatus Paracaedibacteraceae bacterium]
MPDNRFYINKGPFTLAQIADFLKLTLHNCSDPSLEIQDLLPLQQAKDNNLACYHNHKYQQEFQATQAGACIVAEELVSHAPTHLPLLISKTPYRDYARLLSLFYEEKKPIVNISPTARIAPTAKIGHNCTIGDYAVIGEYVEIGENGRIGPHSVIEAHCIIGSNCQIESHVSISNSLIGNHVSIKPGARIGQRGFGFDMDAKGHVPVPQLGRVIIGDYVDIGANTTIDRGSNADTEIHKGVRIDNQVMIAHNVIIGDHSVLVAQVGIAGSTRLGKFVIAAGQVGIAGHLTIGDSVQIAAKSGLMRDVDAGAKVAGYPAIPIQEHFKQVAVLAKLTKTKGK